VPTVVPSSFRDADHYLRELKSAIKSSTQALAVINALLPQLDRDQLWSLVESIGRSARQPAVPSAMAVPTRVVKPR